jgi:hypothetical protein
MLRHIVAWNCIENAQTVKAELEALTGLIDEVKELKVHINPLPSSSREIVLDSLFESEEALAAYQVHPEHKRVVGVIAPFIKDRVCLDYII